MRSHRELKKDREEDWENLALAYLRVCALVHEGGDELQDVLSGLKTIETEQEGKLSITVSIKLSGN